MATFKSAIGKMVRSSTGLILFKKEEIKTDCEHKIKALRGAVGVSELDGDKAPIDRDDDLELARQLYQEKFGEKPHGNKSLESINEAISELGE